MVNLVVWMFLLGKDHPTRKSGKRHIYGSIRVLGRMRVVKNDRGVRVVVGERGGLRGRNGAWC